MKWEPLYTGQYHDWYINNKEIAYISDKLRAQLRLLFFNTNYRGRTSTGGINQIPHKLRHGQHMHFGRGAYPASSSNARHEKIRENGSNGICCPMGVALLFQPWWLERKLWRFNSSQIRFALVLSIVPSSFTAVTSLFSSCRVPQIWWVGTSWFIGESEHAYVWRLKYIQTILSIRIVIIPKNDPKDLFYLLVSTVAVEIIIFLVNHHT